MLLHIWILWLVEFGKGNENLIFDGVMVVDSHLIRIGTSLPLKKRGKKNKETPRSEENKLLASHEPHLERGDKIIMPPSALDLLASLHIDYPMLFELRNPSASRVTHCGVLEFIADEDDGKHASSRGRHCAIEKCKPGKGNLCEAAASHFRLLRYQQPQSNFRDFIEELFLFNNWRYNNVEEEPAKKIPKFSPFTGAARRLDGKFATELAKVGTDPASKQHQQEAGEEAIDSKPSTSAPHSHSEN